METVRPEGQSAAGHLNEKMDGEDFRSLAAVQPFLEIDPSTALSVAVDDALLVAPRAIQKALRGRLCDGILNRDAACILYLEAFLVQLTTPDDKAERLTMAALQFRALLAELRRVELLGYTRQTRMAHLTAVGADTDRFLVLPPGRLRRQLLKGDHIVFPSSFQIKQSD